MANYKASKNRQQFNWIIIPQKGIIEVFKNLEDGQYAKKSTFKMNSKWTFDTFELAVKGSDFLIV